MLKVIKPEMKNSWDLWLIILLSAVLIMIISLIPTNSLLIVIGLPFVLFFPGYALITTLFPNKKSIVIVERIALSFATSIIEVLLIGVGLSYTPIGIRLESILWSLILLNIVFCVLGMWRRSIIPEPFRLEIRHIIDAIKIEYRKNTKPNQILTFLLIVAILSSVVALVYVAVVPREREHFSEFFILGPGGEATDYPHNLIVGESAQVILGIANHEYKKVNYSVEVWLTNTTYSENITIIHQLIYMDEFSVVLDYFPTNSEDNLSPEWQESYNFSISIPGIYKIWFVLLLDDIPFQGVNYHDYVNTLVENRFLSMVNSNSYDSLNLNLNIAA